MAKDKQAGAAGRPPEDLPEDLEDLAEDLPEDLPEDLEDLARRYVDLWQDQMTALAADPEFADSLQKAMGAMGVAASGLPALWSAWPAAMTSLMTAAQPGGGHPHAEANPDGQESHEQPAGGKHNGSGGGAQAGAKAAAAASDGGGTDLGVLQERLAALEQRVRSLEKRPGDGGTGRARGRAKGKTQRD